MFGLNNTDNKKVEFTDKEKNVAIKMLKIQKDNLDKIYKNPDGTPLSANDAYGEKLDKIIDKFQ